MILYYYDFYRCIIMILLKCKNKITLLYIIIIPLVIIRFITITQKTKERAQVDVIN